MTTEFEDASGTDFSPSGRSRNDRGILVAAMHCSREQIALEHRPVLAVAGSIANRLQPRNLRGSRAKQRMLRNPRSSRFSTSLCPIKPVDPVIRIRSSRPTIRESNSDWSMFWLLGDIWLTNRIDADEREEPSDVIGKVIDVTHRRRLSQQKRATGNAAA